MTLNWYIAYTKPRHEDLVAKRLHDAGFEVLNPKLRERRYFRRKLQDMVGPLFPGYVFVRFDLYRSYRLIKYTRGIRKLVGTEAVPTEVPEEIISSIKGRMTDGLIRLAREEFEQGAEVVVKEGPFQGLDAVFEKPLKGVERVSILLKTVNARVVIDRALISRAGAGR